MPITGTINSKTRNWSFKTILLFQLISDCEPQTTVPKGRLMANKVSTPTKNGMSGKITKILAPIDFSEASLNALETAASLAAKCEAVLYILYAHDNILEFIGVNTAAAKSV